MLDQELFSPLNQVDLILRKSGQPFYWAEKVKIWAKNNIKFWVLCQMLMTIQLCNQYCDVHADAYVRTLIFETNAIVSKSVV